MKNLFKHIIVPYLILWIVQILIWLSILFFLDHSSIIISSFLPLIMIVFIFLNFWLCNSLIGLLSKKREYFDALYPGKQWHIDFYRYIWPMIAAIIPFLLLIPVYSSGIYWHIQEKYFLWPSFPDSTYYLTKNHLIFIVRFFSILCVIFSVFMLISIFNYKQKKSLAEKIILWLFVLFFTIVRLGNIIQVLKVERVEIIEIPITVILFLWFAFLKPKKTTNSLSKSNINYYLFAGLVIFQLALIFNSSKFNGFIPPFNYYLAICLAAFSFYKAGLVPAIIGALCGLNLWSAIWWFFCLPDSVLCKCLYCGKLTFSFRKKCPHCQLPLEYKVSTFISSIKNKVRPGVIVVFIILCFFFLAYNIDKKINRKMLQSKKIILMVIAPYDYSNIVIRNSGKIIGTNSAIVNISDIVDSQIFNDSLMNDYSYELNGEKLIAKNSGNNRYNYFITVIRTNVHQKIALTIKQLAIYNYKTNKINKIDKLNNDAEAIELIKNSYNKSLYQCCEIMISNYWYSLSEKQQRERFNYYLQLPARYPLGNFIDIVAQISNPDWFKSTPVITNSKNSKGQKVYSEKEALNILFSINNNRFAYYRLLNCSSPLIRKICTAIAVRNPFITDNIRKVSPKDLLYLRKKIKEREIINKKEWRNYTLMTRIYIKILLYNPDLILQEDIEIVKKGLKLDFKYAGYSVSLENAMALDKHEIWNYIGTFNKINLIRRRFKQSFFPRELMSTNIFEVCNKLEKKNSFRNHLKFYINIYSRINNENAVKKVLEILPDHIYHVAKSDAINRTKIMKRFAEQSTNCNLTAEVICKYPFPGAEEVLKSIRDKCSKENRIKIDAFLQDDYIAGRLF